MRLIRICTNYPTYLKQFYANQKGLADEPYEVQYKRLVADCYGWADFWTHAFGKLGYEVWEPVANAESMQKKWAHENSFQFDEHDWLRDILIAQVKHFKPDILFSNDYHTFDYHFYERLRQECPSIRFIIGWCGAPFKDSKVFDAYNLVLSNIPKLVDHFRNNGHRCEHVHHAFNPLILDKLKKNEGKNKDFTFIGSIVKQPYYHNQREQLLKYIVKRNQLEIYADLKCPGKFKSKVFLLRQNLYGLAEAFAQIRICRDLMTAISAIENRINKSGLFNPNKYIDFSIVSKALSALFGLRMYQMLFDSKITLNTHIDISSEFASNMRLFEATGVGTCLLTERQANLKDIFEPDTEVATYSCPQEAVEKANYLLANADERKQIAEAGQQRTIKNHTFEQRAGQIDQMIRKWSP